jgi:hypothetical protein
MADVHLVLTSSERDLLARILGSKLKQKRVEVHRTEFSRDFREDLETEEAQIHDLLDKIAHSVEMT